MTWLKSNKYWFSLTIISAGIAVVYSQIIPNLFLMMLACASTGFVLSLIGVHLDWEGSK